MKTNLKSFYSIMNDKDHVDICITKCRTALMFMTVFNDETLKEFLAFQPFVLTQTSYYNKEFRIFPSFSRPRLWLLFPRVS